MLRPVTRAGLTLLTLAAAATAAGGGARAGELACRFEGGVIVVPAEVAGIAGDFILDTGTARTTLHETKAQTEGITDTALTGEVRLAGLRTPPLSIAVADLDARTWNLPTAVVGVIGMDVLKDRVLDVRFRPCRIRLETPADGPRAHGRGVALGWDLGRPTARAEASDDARTVSGPFVVATGAGAPVRLSDDVAGAPGAPRPQELYPDGVWLARLPRVTFAGAVGEDVPAGLMAPEGDVAGVLGGPVLAHFHLRFDFPAGRLTLTPAR